MIATETEAHLPTLEIWSDEHWIRGPYKDFSEFAIQTGEKVMKHLGAVASASASTCTASDALTSASRLAQSDATKCNFMPSLYMSVTTIDTHSGCVALVKGEVIATACVTRDACSSQSAARAGQVSYQTGCGRVLLVVSLSEMTHSD